MNNAINEMLSRYTCKTIHDYEQALREILQEVALVGLWRGKFFEHAAFYGGTALRVLYNLDRFSEDLDFTLIKPDPHWKWSPYAEALKNELLAFGFEASFEEKMKQTTTPIKSAFLKTPTLSQMLKIGVHSNSLKGMHRDAMIRIKVEIDTNPSVEYDYEQKFLTQPVPVSVKCVSEECLFACKMHAALYRAWKGRVKGRDWYDLVWFIRRKTPFNLSFFSKLENLAVPLDRVSFIKNVKERIDRLDMKSAIEDIIHFVKDQQSVRQNWSQDFFKYWIDQIQTKSDA